MSRTATLSALWQFWAPFRIDVGICCSAASLGEEKREHVAAGRTTRGQHGVTEDVRKAIKNTLDTSLLYRSKQARSLTLATSPQKLKDGELEIPIISTCSSADPEQQSCHHQT